MRNREDEFGRSVKRLEKKKQHDHKNHKINGDNDELVLSICCPLQRQEIKKIYCIRNSISWQLYCTKVSSLYLSNRNHDISPKHPENIVDEQPAQENDGYFKISERNYPNSLWTTKQQIALFKELKDKEFEDRSIYSVLNNCAIT